MRSASVTRTRDRRGTRRLVLVRHGETLDNAAGIWQGLKDSELSPVGHAQADKAAPCIAAYRPEGLVASDLERARQTAERIGTPPVCRCGSTRGCARSTWGSGRAMTTAEVRGRDPELLAAMGRGEDVRRGAGRGRPSAELAARVGAALDDVVAELAPGASASSSCHGAPRCKGGRRTGRAGPDARPAGAPGARQLRTGRAGRGLARLAGCAGAATTARRAWNLRPGRPRARLTGPISHPPTRVGYDSRVALAVRGRRGCGAAGSAPPWHGGGQGFESPQLHEKVLARPLRGVASTFRGPSGPTLLPRTCWNAGLTVGFRPL